MTGDTLRQFELIKRICGEQNYGNVSEFPNRKSKVLSRPQVLLVTTHWPERPEDQKKQHCALREGDLRRDFWKDMIRGGSTMCRFDDQHSTAKAIIRRLAGKPDITLALQDEMANGKSLKGTTAFSFIVNARQQDEERLKAAAESAGNDLNDIGANPESIDIRKEGENTLDDEIVVKVRTAIAREDAEARRRNIKLRVQNVMRWLIGLTNVASGIAQVALGAVS